MAAQTAQKKIPKLRFPGFSGEWGEKKLGDIANFRRGSFPQPYGLRKWYDDKNGFPFVQVYDVDNNSKLKEVTKRKISKEAKELSVFAKEGTIVLTIQGSIGRIALTQYDACIDRTLLIFESFNIPIDKYFFMQIVFLLFEIEKTKAPGGTIKTITKEALSSFKLSVPSLLEQQKIAGFLGSVDEWIENLKSQKDNFESYKKGMMQKIFSQEIRFKDDNGKEFPKWEEKKLGDFKDLITGDGDWILSNDITIGEKYKVVQLGNIGLGKYIDKNLKTISEKSFLKLNGTLINKGDLLINRMVDNSLCCCIFPKSGNYITSVDVCWIRENNHFNNYFFMSLILVEENQDRLLSISAGSGRVRISRKNLFTEFEFKLPNLKEQQKIADFLTSIDDLIESKQQQITQAEEWKKGLMQGLFV